MLSFPSGLDPLIRAGPSWAHIELGRVGLESSLKSGLHGGLTRLVLIGHILDRQITLDYITQFRNVDFLCHALIAGKEKERDERREKRKGPDIEPSRVSGPCGGPYQPIAHCHFLEMQA